MSEHIEQLKEEEKASMDGQVEQPAEHRERQGWIVGVILIGLGVIFLLNNYFDIELVENWWALFILIPAAANLSRAWRSYQAAGHWTDEARGSLVGGLLISTVAFMFLFSLNWGMFWPVLLIIFGMGLLLKAM